MHAPWTSVHLSRFPTPSFGETKILRIWFIRLIDGLIQSIKNTKVVLQKAHFQSHNNKQSSKGEDGRMRLDNPFSSD